MASFFCHVFGVTKQVRLERIVRAQTGALRQTVRCCFVGAAKRQLSVGTPDKRNSTLPRKVHNFNVLLPLPAELLSLEVDIRFHCAHGADSAMWA